MKPCPKCGARQVRDAEWACRECKAEIIGKGAPGPDPKDHWVTTPRQTLGVVALLCGFGAMAYFLLAFDPSVRTEFGRVNNLGLLQDRQNGLFLGGVLVIVGVLLTLFGGRRR